VDERDAAEPAQLLREPSQALRIEEASDPFGRPGEGHAVPGGAGAEAERDRQVRLAGARRSQEDDVLLAEQEVELGEVQHEILLQRALEAQSNSSSVLRLGKRAARMRASPPWVSRDERSVAWSASAKRS